MKWISVKERYPKGDESFDILVVTKNKKGNKRFIRSKVACIQDPKSYCKEVKRCTSFIFRDYLGSYISEEVTHWMSERDLPLPESD